MSELLNNHKIKEERFLQIKNELSQKEIELTKKEVELKQKEITLNDISNRLEKLQKGMRNNVF